MPAELLVGTMRCFEHVALDPLSAVSGAFGFWSSVAWSDILMGIGVGIGIGIRGRGGMAFYSSEVADTALCILFDCPPAAAVRSPLHTEPLTG